MRSAHSATPTLLDTMQQRYAERRDSARGRLTELHRTSEQLTEQAAVDTVEHLLIQEKAELGERLRVGLVRRDAFDRLAADVDARLVQLRRGRFDRPADLLRSTEQGGFEKDHAVPDADPAVPDGSRAR